jgi:hypothetical protein
VPPDQPIVRASLERYVESVVEVIRLHLEMRTASEALIEASRKLLDDTAELVKGSRSSKL